MLLCYRISIVSQQHTGNVACNVNQLVPVLLHISSVFVAADRESLVLVFRGFRLAVCAVMLAPLR